MRRLRVAILTMPVGDRGCDGERKDASIINDVNVKWFEDLDVDVVPVNFIECNVGKVMKECDGLYLQGGPNHDARYVALVAEFLEASMKRGQKKWPIWGTCHGFQCIVRIFFGHLSRFNSRKYRTKLTKVVRVGSRMFSGAGEDVIRDLKSGDVEFNNQFGLSIDDFKHPDANVQEKFRITALCRDRDGREMVAGIEAIDWPIYGVQFHPERMNGAGGVWLREFFVGEMAAAAAAGSQRRTRKKLKQFCKRYPRVLCIKRCKTRRYHNTTFSGRHCYYF